MLYLQCYNKLTIVCVAKNQTRTPDLSFQISEDWTTSRHNDIQLWSKTTKCLALKIDALDDATQVLKLKYKIESLPTPALQVICNWFCDSPIISNIPPLWLIIHKDIHTVSHQTNVNLWSCIDWKWSFHTKFTFIVAKCEIQVSRNDVQMMIIMVIQWCPNDRLAAAALIGCSSRNVVSPVTPAVPPFPCC